MKEKLDLIRSNIEENIAKAEDLKAIEEIKVKYLGKKGELTTILKSMGSLAKEERPKAGQLVNDVRIFAEDLIEKSKETITNAQIEARLKSEKIDVTIPPEDEEIGHKHPMTNVIDEIKNIFIGMGYKIAEGPEIEKEYYNFEALNIAKNHPARDEQDTFYVGNGMLLRTQTSPVQVRVMEEGELPIRVISPGRVFRADEVDATHSPVFHQLEGLVIDKEITMGDLKGALAVFAKELLGEETKVRFRPHHFPFTEPSAEMDVSCFACGGSGCRVCKDSGWIEGKGRGVKRKEQK